PQDLSGSNGAWPVTPAGGRALSHWPFRFGYFASSNARAPSLVTISAAIMAAAPIKLRETMLSSLSLPQRYTDCAGRRKGVTAGGPSRGSTLFPGTAKLFPG